MPLSESLVIMYSIVVYIPPIYIFRTFSSKYRMAFYQCSVPDSEKAFAEHIPDYKPIAFPLCHRRA